RRRRPSNDLRPSERSGMTLGAVPDALLHPLLDTAADTLRTLDPEDVPVALRALSGFDRRGLSSATARHQLRRGFDLEGGFRDRVAERFGRRPEVVAVLARWAADPSIAVVVDAADRAQLALLAAAL